MTLPLEGIKVLELAGPPGTWVTGMLADFGAEVIKVARVPLPQLRFGYRGLMDVGSIDDQKRNAAFNPYDRNKRSIALSLKSPEGRKIFFELVKTTDVELEGFRPGVADRLGIGYETLREINPGLIYCTITGYGQDGPYRDLVGHDINYVAMAGVIDLTGKRNGPPLIPGAQIADFGAGGSQGVIGILLALMARQRTGKGQFVDIAMTDGVISLLMAWARDYYGEGFLPPRGESVRTGGAPWHNIYEAKDKKYISIGCWEPHLWENLCRALGREDFIPHQYAVGQKKKEIFSTFKEIFRTKTRDEWFQSLKDKEVCISPVYSIDEVYKDPQVLHRKMLVGLDHPELGEVKQVGISIKLSETPGSIRSFGPRDGQNTEEILRELGYSEEQIKELGRSGAVIQAAV